MARRILHHAVKSTVDIAENKKGQPFPAGLRLLNHINLEVNVSVENHRAVCAGVRPIPAEGTRRSLTGGNVPVVDVQPRYAQVLVVESVKEISPKLQGDPLVEFEVLGYRQVQLIAVHG